MAHDSRMALTRDQILDTTETLLRRFGPNKLTVVDVARALEVSHGSLYRFLASKKALLDAVVARWLAQVSQSLQEIATHTEIPAEERLRLWFRTLIGLKRRKVLDDPELFATYHQIAEQAHDVVEEHDRQLIGQLRTILISRPEAGGYGAQDAPALAELLFTATVWYHHPHHVLQQGDRDPWPRAERLIELLITGLRYR